MTQKTKTKPKRNSYAIPYYLRSEGSKIKDEFTETECGLIQKDVLARIHNKHIRNELKHEAAAAELDRAAAYIRHLRQSSVKKQAAVPRAEEAFSSNDIGPLLAQLGPLLAAIVKSVK